MTESLISYLQKKPFVAILRGVQSNEIISIARVLVDSGFSIIEVPLNSPDPLTSITNLSNEFGEKILIGAGTVLQKTDVLDIKNAGAKLAVAPNANPEVITAAKDGGLITIPGIATPTEAFTAIGLGADALKLFPAESAPPEVLKAFKAVLPKPFPVLPVGGITPEKIGPYIQAGASGFGLGSALYKPGSSAKEVHEKAEKVLEMANSVMEEAGKEIFGVEVALIAEGSYGESWGDAK